MHDRLTASDIRKMEEEIEYRKVILRKELLEDVKDARAQGDLSENFEYYAAKKAFVDKIYECCIYRGLVDYKDILNTIVG